MYAHLRFDNERRRGFEGDVWDADTGRLEGQYKGVLGASTAQQVIRKNSEAWCGFFRLKDQYHDESDTSVTEHPEPAGFWGTKMTDETSRLSFATRRTPSNGASAPGSRYWSGSKLKDRYDHTWSESPRSPERARPKEQRTDPSTVPVAGMLLPGSRRPAETPTSEEETRRSRRGGCHRYCSTSRFGTDSKSPSFVTTVPPASRTTPEISTSPRLIGDPASSSSASTSAASRAPERSRPSGSTQSRESSTRSTASRPQNGPRRGILSYSESAGAKTAYSGGLRGTPLRLRGHRDSRSGSSFRDTSCAFPLARRLRSSRVSSAASRNPSTSLIAPNPAITSRSPPVSRRTVSVKLSSSRLYSDEAFVRFLRYRDVLARHPCTCMGTRET